MDNATVLVFGATGGVGSALARKLAEEGKKVLLCSRNENKLRVLSDEIHQPFYICNSTSEEEVQKTLDKASEEHGFIDGVANCIGSFFIKPLSLTTFKEFNDVLQINLHTCFNILKASTEHMVLQKKGAIVLVSSCAAQIGLQHHEAISASKAAVEALVRSAAASYAHKGIRINAIAPGLLDTPLSRPLTSNAFSLKASLGFHPLGRIGSAKDAAAAIAWLLSGESSWITGEVLCVDGGLSHIKTKNN